MSHRTFKRLERLQTLNSNRLWKNRDLYRLMYKEDLYILAYEQIKSKPGNMTPGTDEETLDGFSLEAIREIIREMRTEQFQFKPVQTAFIPKANGKMRKLGIPCVRDKIVQQVMYMIMTAIYDSPDAPYFQETSHGFRPGHSCHTALREIRRKWSATNWLIEGDIRSCFDEIHHATLVRSLSKKITDQRFLNLIWKLLNAGYMDLRGARKDSLVGTPQGSVLSPILANVYLHELDEFIEELRAKQEKGQRKGPNPLYQQLSTKKKKLVQQGRTKTKEFRDAVHEMRSLPSTDVDDPNFVRIKYLRYADDWIIGVCGNHALAEEIKQAVKTFLQEHLSLTLNEEKTHITNARTEEAFFLGTLLKMGNHGAAKVTLSTSRAGRRFKRRSTGWETVMKAPMPKLLKRMGDKGFCTQEGRPTSKSGWSFLDVDQIISLYNGVNRGIQNYYRFVDNWRQVRRIQYILRFSLAMTLARKFKITTSQVFKRFGKQPTYVIKDKDGKEVRRISFYNNQDWTKSREAFQGGKVSHIDQIRMAIRMRTRSKLGRACCICDEALERIVMHHVRHIRKLSRKKEATGFNRVLRMLNRKQIPVCERCHAKIHRGEYDGIKLTDFARVPC